MTPFVKVKWLGAYRFAYERTCRVFHLLGHDLPEGPGLFIYELLAMMKDTYSDDDIANILKFVESHTLGELTQMKKLTLKQIKEQVNGKETK